MILGCLETRSPLEGSCEADGIDQCRCLVLEMEKMIRVKEAAPVKDAPVLDAPALAAAASAVAPDEFPALAEDGVLHEESNPLRDEAVQKVEVALSRISYYNTKEELKLVLNHQVVPSQRVYFVVDAPTSKTPVIATLIATCSEVAEASGSQNLRICIPVGRRLDVLHLVSSLIVSKFPGLLDFAIPLTYGKPQITKRKQNFCVVAVPATFFDTGSLPNFIDALSGRAHDGEGTRLRCLTKACPLRPLNEIASPNLAKDPQAELDKNDTEVPQEDEGECKNDEKEDEPNEEMEVLEPPARDCCCEIFTHARSKDYYKKMLTGVCGHEPIAHVIYLTTTSHPSLPLAAFELGAQVHVLVDRKREHNQAHGDKLLKDQLYTKYYRDLVAVQDKSKKRVLNADIVYVWIVSSFVFSS